jgi:hypothetical protein
MPFSRFVIRRAAHGVALCALGLAACSPETPTASPTAAAPVAPPDFTGVWMAFASVNPQGGFAPQYSSEGQEAIEAFYSQFTEVPDPGAFCVPTGMPSIMLSTVAYPVEIVQTDARITMLAELKMQVRRVFLDGRKHPTDYLPTGVGHSIGRWDGNQLFIDTALLQEWQARPWPRTEQTHIEERLYLTKRADVTAPTNAFVATVEAPIDDDVLVVELTLTDPSLYSGPQQRTVYYQRMADTATLEYACAMDLWLQELEKNRVSQ